MKETPYRKWLIGGGIIVLVLLTVVFWTEGTENEDLHLPKKVDFNAHIRPILSQNCYICHGPDSSSREAGLRLDTYEGATATLEDGGAAIVPGSPRKSLLIRRLHAEDPEERMPPPEAKKILSDREIALLNRWIDQGAEWKAHWSFIPPEMPDLPRSKRKSSPADIIDYLIEEQFSEQGLTPSPQANHANLVRRVAYLLTGLPPTPEEIQRFAADTTEAGYETMVDHYLASPHLGERWARHWMDLVRYGEGMGHEFDYAIHNAFEYRDYLIRAFNQDVPYDLFVKEHLAGDMLETPRYHPEADFNESVLGTAYYNLGEGKHAPVNIKLEESSKIDNGIDVTSKTFQALTVACAKCHDHKFDPIPTTDYYAMYGMFESSRMGPVAGRQTRKQISQLEELYEVKQDIRKGLGQEWLEELSKESVFQLTQFIQETALSDSLPEQTEDYQLIGDFRNGEWLGWYTDGWAFGDGPLMGKPLFDSASQKFRGLESGFASSRAIGKGVQGVLRSPNFMIEHDTIAIRARGNGGMYRIIVDNFQIIQGPLYDKYERVLDEEEWKTYFVDVSLVKGHKAYLQFTPGHYSQKQRHVYQIERDNYVDVQYALHFRNGFPQGIDQAVNEPPSAAHTDKQQALKDWMQGEANPSQVTLVERMTETFKAKAASPSISHLLKKEAELVSQLYDSTHFIGLSEGEAVYSSVFVRGSIDNLSEEKVPHRFLDAIEVGQEAYPQQGSGRLAWAEAVVDPANPLTTRVISNRIWHHIFGRGIVETVDNFGLQGKFPSHPALLDYLAIQFQKDGWSMKQMMKHILLTQTFRRSTESLADNQSKDPNNVYLHHFPIRRLEAEAIRDGILTVSGSLNRDMYGPSVPIYLSEFMTGRGRPRNSGPLDGNGRRSIYIAIKRNFLSPMMLAFDMPIPFSTFGKRNTTNVPGQSLTLMNDPFVQEQASLWAERILEEEVDSFEDRIQQMYIRAFGRAATAEELSLAQAFMENQATSYESDFETMADDPQLWTDYCHALFNLKEFIHLL